MSSSPDDREVLDMLRQCKKEHGICSPRVFDSMEDTCSSSLVMRRFGSWLDAKDEAGINEDPRSETTGQKQVYSDEQVLSHIRECYRREVTDEFGNVAYSEGKCTVEKLQACEDLVAPSVVIERFGSWINGKKEAGIDLDKRETNVRRPYTDEDYLQLIRKCEERYGKVTPRLFNKLSEDDPSHPNTGAVRERFADEESGRDGWQIAKRKADFNT